MDEKIKSYINSLKIECIPWHRMFTAYGTAEMYRETLSTLEETVDAKEWKEKFITISDFEHQSTMFPPAPFALVFLVRMLDKHLNSKTESSDVIAQKLIDQFIYYVEVCNDAENMDHAQQLDNFSDMLDEKYLLSEDCDDEELDEIFENPDAVPDDLFYSFYYYSKIVLSQVPDILDKYGKYKGESMELKSKIFQR